MANANIKILKEVILDKKSGWKLCFQWTKYKYTNDRKSDLGYRFIWRKPNGNLQAARGQARIPSGQDMFKLITLATSEGWFITCENEYN